MGEIMIKNAFYFIWAWIFPGHCFIHNKPAMIRYRKNWLFDNEINWLCVNRLDIVFSLCPEFAVMYNPRWTYMHRREWLEDFRPDLFVKYQGKIR